MGEKVTARKQNVRSTRRGAVRGILFSGVCWVCGKKVRVNFQPSRLRPVYCSTHLRQLKAGSIPAPKLVLIKSIEQHLEALFRRLRWPAVVGTGIAVLGLVFMWNQFTSKAEVTRFYPDVCLGTWRGAQLAQGRPETERGGEFSQFSETNSAVYDGGQKQVFCSKFQGDLPDNAKLKGVNLNLFWALSRQHLMLPAPVPEAAPAEAEPVAPNNSEAAPETTPTSVDATPADTVPPADSAAPTPAPEPETAPSPAEPTAPLPVSFKGAWQKIASFFGGLAQAQEESLPAPEPPTQPETPPIDAPAATPNIAGEPTPAEPASTDTQPTAEEKPAGEPEQPAEPVPAPTYQGQQLTLKYSFDGVDWRLLTTIDPENLTSRFTVPVDSIPALGMVQIAVEARGPDDAPSVIFLDGMALDVEYERSGIMGSDELSPSEIDKLPRVNVEGKDIFLTPNQNFGPSDEPMFELKIPDEPASPTPEVVAPPEPPVVPEFIIVPDGIPQSEAVPPPSSDNVPPAEEPSVGEPAPAPEVSPQPAPQSDGGGENPGESAGAQQGGASSRLLGMLQWVAGILPVGAQGAPLRVLKSEVIDPAGEITAIEPVVEPTESGARLRLPKPERAFHPGVYKLKVELLVGKTVVVSSQEFAWGVLAINVNKSVFKTGEFAFVQMASLDSEGHTLCDSNLLFELTTPSGNATTYKTGDGTITKESSCGADNVTYHPDYYVNLEVREAGSYGLVLKNLDNGYKTESSFQAQADLPFSVERYSATRINPMKAYYHMYLRVTAQQDFTGTIRESVPKDFVVLEPKESTVEQPDRLFITWQVSLKVGEEQRLEYSYFAPPVSPEFYLLGPTEVLDSGGGAVFTEARQWQIAADAITVGTTYNGTACATTTSCTVANVNGSTGVNRLLVAFATNEDSADADRLISGSGVTFGATGMTLGKTQDDTTNNVTAHIYYLINPSGTATVTFNWAGTVTSSIVSAKMLSDVAQSSPVDITGGSNFTNTAAPSVSVNTATDLSIVMGLLDNNVTTACTAGSTAISSLAAGSAHQHMTQYAIKTPTGSQAMAWSGCGSTNDEALAVAAFKPFTIVVSGPVYTDEVPNAMNCSTPKTVRVRVNGGSTSYSGSCTGVSGTYTVTGIPVSASDVLTIYLDGATENATTVIRVASTPVSIFDANLYQNRAWLRQDDAGPITNTNLDTWDNGNETDGDVLYTVTSGALTVAAGYKLVVNSGDTFTPGGSVTTTAASSQSAVDGDVLIQSSATLSMAANSLSVGGDYTNSGASSFTGGGGQTTSFTGTTTGFVITNGTGDFSSVTFNGSGGGWSFNSNVTIDGVLTMTAGTLSGTVNVQVNQDAVGTGGIISMTGGGFTMRPNSARNFGTSSGSNDWSFSLLQFAANCSGASCVTITTQTGGSGAINVSNALWIGRSADGGSPSLNAGNRTWNLTNANQQNPMDDDVNASVGGFTASTSTIVYSGDYDSGDVTIENVTYNNLQLGGAVADNYVPASTTSVTGTLTVNANGTLAGTSSVTVNGLASTGTINLTGGTFTYDDDAGQNFANSNSWTFFNLTFGDGSGTTTTTSTNAGAVNVTNVLTISTSQTLDAKGKTWTLSGSTGTPFSLVGVLDDTANSSTFVFTGSYVSGSTTIPASSGYNNITINNGAEGFMFDGAGTYVLTGDLTLTAGTLTQSSGGGISITINGNFTGAGTVNFYTGTFEQRVTASKTFGSSSGTNTWDFATLIFSNGNGGATPITITPNAGTGGTISVATLLQIGKDTDTAGATTTFNNETSNDRLFDVNGSMTITTRGVWQASSTQGLTIATNYTNDGTFTSNSSTVTLDGLASGTFDSGCTSFTSPGGCTNQDFNILIINKTSGTDGNDNVTLSSTGFYTTTLTITDGELVQGAYNVTYMSGGVSVAAAGKWNNVSTGDLYMGGTFTNAGTVIMNASGGSCSDADGIVLQDALTVSTLYSWAGAGSYDMQDLAVQDSGGSAAITCTGCTDNGNNDVNWTFASCGFNVQGTFYPEAESGNEPGQCDGSTQNLSLRVNTGAATTASCVDTTGTFTFSAVAAAAGDTITIYSTGANKANRVYVSDGNADTGEDLYANTVAVGDDQDGTFSILDLVDYDRTTDTTNMLYDAVDSTPDTLTTINNVELHINTGDNFTPGGTITTDPSSSSSSKDGDVHIDGTGTLTMSTNALSVGGDFNNEGTHSTSNTTTFTATSTGHVITDGGENFSSVTFNGTSGGWSFADSSTITGTLTMTAGTLSGTQDLTVNTAAVGTGGVITLTGGTFENRVAGSQNFGPTTASTTWTFNNLTFSRSAGTPTITKQSCATCGVDVTGTLLVSKTGDGAGTTLSAGNATWTLSNSNSANPFDTDQASGVLSGATSTFLYSGDNDAGNVTLENAGFYNLQLGGAAVESYVPEGNMTIYNDITVNANGTLSGTTDIAVVDGAITGAGTITLTGGTVTDDLTGSQNFGTTSGSNVWTFNNLTFQNSLGGVPVTATTQTGGTGGITITGVLTVSLAGDLDLTSLDAGNRTWTLSNSNSANPFELDGSDGSLTASTSTFVYSGDNDAGNVNIEDNSSYNNLQLGGAVAESYDFELSTTGVVAGDLTVNANGTLLASGGITVNGNVTGAGTITASGTFEQQVSSTKTFGSSSGSLGWTFSNLKFNNSSVAAGNTISTNAGTGTITVTGTLTLGDTGTQNITFDNNTANDRNFDINGSFTIGSHGVFSASNTGTFTLTGNFANSGTFTNNSGTITLDGAAAQTVTHGSQAFGTLTVNNTGTDGANDNITISAGTLDINGDLNLTNGDLVLSTNDPNVTVGGSATLGASSYVTKADNGSATWTFDGSGTSGWTDNHASNAKQNLGLVHINGTSKILYIDNDGLATSVNVHTGQTLRLSLSDIVLTGTGTGASRPFIVDGSLDITTAGCSNNCAVQYSGGGATTSEIESTTYDRLEVMPTVSGSTYRLGSGASQTLTVNTYWWIGDGTATTTIDWTNYDPAITLKGSFDISANVTWTKSDTATLTWSPTGTKVWVDNTSPYADIGTISITGGSSTPTVQIYNGYWVAATSVTVATGHTLDMNGSTSTKLWLTGTSGSPLTLSGGSLANTSGNTVEFIGNGNITIAAATYGNLTFDPTIASSGKTYTGGGAITVAGALDINPDAASALSLTVDLGGTTSVSGATTIRRTNSATSLLSTTGSNHSFTTGSFDIQAGGTLTGNASALDSNGAVTIASSGTLNSTSANFAIAGSVTNNGSFNHNSGTVTLDTTATATLDGSASPAITFNNLTVATAGKTVNFTASKTFRTNGVLTIQGANGNPVHIHSTSGTTQWLINHQGTESVEYAHLEDSGCDGSSTYISLNGTSADGDGNNGSCWLFPSLSFVLSSTSASLGLDEANTFTTTATTGLTVTARAQAGFQCYAYQTDNLRHSDTVTTIADWAGTNASPTTWTGNCIDNSECGWGYSTNDAGLTQFSSTKYAGFTTTAPGEVVAISTGPVTADATTITYKASVSRSQAAGLYQTIVRYIVVPQF